MSFRFRKLYADAVLTDGAVVVVYLTWLDWAGIRTRSAAVECYSADGGRAVWHAADVPLPIDPDCGAPVRIALTTVAGDFRLEYSNGWPGWSPDGAPQGLCWRVLQPRGEALVTWTGADGTTQSRGVGYVDWVDCRRPPRFLHLHSLAWGRAHWSDAASVYTSVRLASGTRWTRAARWRSGALVDTTAEIELEHAADGGLVAAAGTATWLRLGRGRALHCGAGLDRERFPRAFERIAARVLTGAVEETRWRCPVAGSEADRGEASAIHELVYFGRQNRAAAAGARRTEPA